MREHWARMIAMLTGAVVVLLSVAFALLQNPPGTVPAAPEPAPVAIALDPQVVARGRQVFEAQNCMRCHSVGGEGSPRSPLDHAAARLDPAQLLAFTVGSESLADQLSRRTLAAKQPYQQLPAEDLDALVAYLQSLVQGQPVEELGNREED
jgi:mono/diheme cytochrome c family protein